jgi:hypothetical protein
MYRSAMPKPKGGDHMKRMIILALLGLALAASSASAMPAPASPPCFHPLTPTLTSNSCY